MIPKGLENYIAGLKTHDLARIASALSEDVVFVTPAKTMPKDEILAFLAALYRAFPDWSYDHDPPVTLEEGTIGIKWRQGGTHTGRLEFPGFDGVPATGKPVSIPEHFFYYRLDKDLLAVIRPDPVPGGAPRGIFEQIGVELPPL